MRMIPRGRVNLHGRTALNGSRPPLFVMFLTVRRHADGHRSSPFDPLNVSNSTDCIEPAGEDDRDEDGCTSAG